LCTVVPVLFIFVIINAIALFRVIAEYRRTRNIVPALLWIIVFSVWLNVLLFDHIKSVRYVDSKYAQHGAHQSVEKG
jgi:preprotein translocase subunit SecF